MNKFQIIFIALMFGYSFSANATIHNVNNASALGTAISSASANDTINITANITLTSSVNVNKNLTICSMGQKFTITAATSNRIFSISSDLVTIIKNLILTGGNANVGGAIQCGSNCNLTLIDCTFENNSVTNFGGAVSLTGNLTATNCIFKNNSAYFGGAVRMSGGSSTFTATSCIFEDNSASSSGAGGAVSDCGVFNYTTDCVFKNNTPQDFSDIGTTNITLPPRKPGTILQIGGKVYVGPNSKVIIGPP